MQSMCLFSTLRDGHYHCDNESSVKQYILNDDLCMLPGDTSDLLVLKVDYVNLITHQLQNTLIPT
jgi:hypothetical protein